MFFSTCFYSLIVGTRADFIVCDDTWPLRGREYNFPFLTDTKKRDASQSAVLFLIVLRHYSVIYESIWKTFLFGRIYVQIGPLSIKILMVAALRN